MDLRIPLNPFGPHHARLRAPANAAAQTPIQSFLGALVASRHIRVSALIFATIAMSMGDLYMTLAYLRTSGMDEANPLARLVISYGCPWALSAWKALTLGLGMFILFSLRRTRGGELGAWCCFAMLLALTLHWSDYNRDVTDLTMGVTSLAASGDPAWVTISN